MGRVRGLAFSSKSLVQKFMNRREFYVDSSNGLVHLNFRQFQSAFIRSRSNNTAAIWFGYTGKPAEFAPSEVPSLKRFVHSTGVSKSMERDHYKILGISKDADSDEIRKAFHDLAKKYHPDRNKNNPSAKRKFQEIREAYETLRDPEKKDKYDQMREGSRTENAEYSESYKDHFRYDHKIHFSDSFHKIFSEIFENESENLAADIQVELTLTFSEAAKGCIKDLSFDADVPCDSCYGRGHPLDAQTKVCPICQGIGRVTIPPFATTCGTCKGFGRIIKEYCKSCKGSGVCEGIKNVRVTIPSGVDSGDTIRVPGAGNARGRSSSPGNLFIKLKVSESSTFTRQGADLYVDSHISFTQAILGGMVEVPTLSGKMKLQIPKGVQPGQLLLLRGKGLPRSGFFTDHGNQYVRFCIKFPSTVNERQRAILEEFENETIDQYSGSVEGSWWRSWVNHMTQPAFALELSVFLWLLIYLTKS